MYFDFFLLFIIILSTYKKITMDNYKVEKSPLNTTYCPNILLRSQSTMFCDDEQLLTPNDPNYVSENQKLAGQANPKTKMSPIVKPRITELDYWRSNNLINHSHINTESHIDTYLSGYSVSNLFDKIDPFLVPSDKQYNLHQSQPSSCEIGSLIEGYDGDYTYKGDSDEFQQVKNPYTPQEYNMIQSNVPTLTKHLNESGYYPDQVEQSNLPSNLASGNCERNKEMKNYNKNLFTQNIQPDIYTRNEVIEPINSNIGISFTQQFQPTTFSKEDDNSLTYIEHDPLVYQPKMVKQELDMSITEADVYDPRFSGYGTSYRAYTDENIGQTRFYYDDINSVRMPNYIVRSNIDFAKYADSYGPLQDNNKYGNQYTNNIHSLANNTFLTSSLQHRTELQERLMRKRNSELWQKKKYPIHTNYPKK